MRYWSGFSKSAAILTVFLGILLPWSNAYSQITARIAISSPPVTNGLALVPGCPNQGGLLDSISVPVNQPLDLVVVIFTPAPPGGAVFQLSSDDPSVVAAGDPRQAFLPIVTIPEGQTASNSFRIFGIRVGRTLLRITPLTSGFVASAFPLGAWDVNKDGAFKFVDANSPSASCRDAGQPTISTDPAKLATCGVAVKGVAADGVNPLLLRTVSGLPGTSCFEIVSPSPLNQGSIQTPLTTTSTVNSLEYGFSLYTPPSFYGDGSEKREVEVEFTYTPNIGNGNTTRLRAKSEIVRPPVMLIHGIWSNGNSWNNDFRKNNATRTTVAGDYQATNAASFATNSPRVRTFLDEALAGIRNKGYGATQADVIAHSMGGLLTRLYTGSGQYQRPENLNQGDVHRLVTLDTPHYGSNFANLLVALHRLRSTETESTVQNITGGLVTQGAVCDLAENSAALAGLTGGTAVRSQVFTATGGPAGTPASPAPYWGGVLGFRSFESALTRKRCVQRNILFMCTQEEDVFPQDVVDGFRFREQNDAVVPLSSQQAGLGGINFAGLIHFHVPAFGGGITDDSGAATRAFDILQGPDSGLSASLPGVLSTGTGAARTVPGRGAAQDQQDYANQCGPGGPLKLNLQPVAQGKTPRLPVGQTVADPRVNITSPPAGTTLAPGANVNVVVELTPPLTANDIGVNAADIGKLEGFNYTGSRYEATLAVPIYWAGPLRLSPEITDTNNTPIVGPEVVYPVQPLSPPATVHLVQRMFAITPPLPTSRQLYLNGVYPDGVERDITSAAVGTTYSSSNMAVVTVDADGLCQIAGPGTALVTAQNSGLSDYATFLVEEPSNPNPPENLTSRISVTRGGFRLDRASGFFLQDVTVRNTSGSPLIGPLFLVISNLTAGVSLVNRDGVTTVIPPPGSNYFRLNLSDGLTLPAGSTVNFTFQFLNPSRASINYVTDLFRFTGTP